MVSRLLFFTFTLLLFEFSQAQSDKLAKDVKQDFVTPDHPAFKILGTDPSNILRPSNVKEFSTITGDYFKPPAYVIPRSFSAEIAPALLARSNKLSLADYAKNFVGYSCRVSLATVATDDKWQKRELGAGFRMTFIDKGDFRKDPDFLKGLALGVHQAHLLRDIFETRAIAQIGGDAEYNRLQKEYDKAAEAYSRDSLAAITNNTPGSADKAETEKNRAADAINDYITSRQKELFDNYAKDPNKYKPIEDSINQLRERFKENNWNADRLDMGLALKFITPDTVFSKNMRYDKFSFWIAGAKRIEGKAGKAQQQLIFGGNFTQQFKRLDSRDTVISVYDSVLNAPVEQKITTSADSIKQQQFTYSFSLRYYLGTNRIKGFTELQLEGSRTVGHKYLSFEPNHTHTSHFSLNSFRLLINAGLRSE